MTVELTRERKIMLIGAGILLLMITGYLVFPLVRDAFPSREVIAAKQLKLKKYQQKAREKQALENRRGRLERFIKRWESGLLQAGTGSLAAAEVQRIVSDIIENTGAQVRTTRILPIGSDAQQDYAAVPIEITVQATMPQLLDVLYALQASRTILRIQEIGIRALGTLAVEQKILSTLKVEGFLKNKEG